MPGSRLTRQDREQISAGLAMGLRYRVIARRLGRPTSTITREIARNGGPAGYRAGRAEEATRHRARRRGQTPSRVAEPTDSAGRDPDVVRAVGEELTELLVRTGLPRMAARVFGCLYLTDSGSLTARQLVELLRVSPASVSKAVAYLEGQELIRRERDVERRDRYVVDEDIWYRSLVASARRNTELAAAAYRSAERLGTDTPAGTRLAEGAGLLRLVGEEIIRAVDERRPAPRKTAPK